MYFGVYFGAQRGFVLCTGAQEIATSGNGARFWSYFLLVLGESTKNKRREPEATDAPRITGLAPVRIIYSKYHEFLPERFREHFLSGGCPNRSSGVHQHWIPNHVFFLVSGYTQLTLFFSARRRKFSVTFLRCLSRKLGLSTSSA